MFQKLKCMIIAAGDEGKELNIKMLNARTRYASLIKRNVFKGIKLIK